MKKININENKINKQYPVVNVLSPSIKFDPLITIKIQKVVNNKFSIFLSSKKSKKWSLSELIFISKKNKKGYGTSSSSIIAIPSDKEKYNKKSKPIFLFNSRPIEKNNYYSITTWEKLFVNVSI